MPQNTTLAADQAAALGKQVSAIQEARDALLQYQSSLNIAWTAAEMVYINRTIDVLGRQLSEIGSAVDCLRRDVERAAQDILEEALAQAEALHAEVEKARATGMGGRRIHVIHQS